MYRVGFARSWRKVGSGTILSRTRPTFDTRVHHTGKVSVCMRRFFKLREFLIEFFRFFFFSLLSFWALLHAQEIELI